MTNPTKIYKLFLNDIMYLFSGQNHKITYIAPSPPPPLATFHLYSEYNINSVLLSRCIMALTRYCFIISITQKAGSKKRRQKDNNPLGLARQSQELALSSNVVKVPSPSPTG